MTSNPSTSVSLTESLITTGAFTGANWLVWGTRVATWLNCPASPLGMALAGAMQGVTAGFVKTFATHSFDLQNRPWLQTAIAVGGIALGTFAAFLLAKPFAAYVGVITLRAAISSAILCSLIQVISSYVYSRFVPPQPRLQQLLQNLGKIDKMKEDEFNALLKDLIDELEKNPPKSWDDLHLPLRVRYAIQSKITQEKRTLPPPPLPTDTTYQIEKMKTAEFVELLFELDKKKEPLLWNKLSLDIQYAIWTYAFQNQSQLPEFPQPPIPTSTLKEIEDLQQNKFEDLLLVVNSSLYCNRERAVNLWDNLPLSCRYVIWNRMLIYLPDNMKEMSVEDLPPLPTASPEGIKKMSGENFQELLYLTTQQDGQKAPFWGQLSEEVQNAIEQRSRGTSQPATNMPPPSSSNEPKAASQATSSSPPQPRTREQLLQELSKIDKMGEDEFNAFLNEFLDEMERNPPTSWDDLPLPLRVRYALHYRIVQEQKTLTPPSLPTDAAANIEAMEVAECKELLAALEKNKDQFPWADLSLDVQYAIWNKIVENDIETILWPPCPTSTPEKIEAMTNEQFEDLLTYEGAISCFQAGSFTRKTPLPVNFWGNLSLSVRYAIWNRIIQESKVRHPEDNPLPTDSLERIEKMPDDAFQELLSLTTQQDGKEALFWGQLSEEVQKQIWQKRYTIWKKQSKTSQPATDMPLPPLSREQKKGWGIRSRSPLLTCSLPKNLPEEALAIVEQSLRVPLFQVTFLRTTAESYKLKDCTQALEAYDKLQQAIKGIPEQIKKKVILEQEQIKQIDDWALDCVKERVNSKKESWERARDYYLEQAERRK